MEQERPVRRVLAYIVPDPGVTASDRADDEKTRPAVGDVALASLFRIPLAETIKEQIDEINEHNRRVGRGRQDIVDVMRLLNALYPDLARPEPPAGLFDIYRRRRLEGVVDYIVESVEQGTGRGLGRRARHWLQEVFIRQYGEIAAYAGWVPNQWPGTPFADRPGDAPDAPPVPGAPIEEWPWGMYPVEFYASVIFDLLRRGERVRELVAREQNERRPFPELTGTPPAGHEPECDWADPDQPTPLERETPAGYLAPYWKRAFRLVDGLRRQRSRETTSWGRHGEVLLQIFESSPNQDEARAVVEWLRASIRDLRRTPIAATDEVVEADRRREQGALALVAARLVHAIRRELSRDRTAVLGIALTPERPVDSADALNLLAMIDYLDRPTVRGVLDALVAVEVVQYALGDRRRLTEDVQVELVQISGTGTSPLGALPIEEKLSGLQLGHFSAFYKASWRANDWMQGRLDGSERLVRILLNPDRLRRLYAGAPGARQFVYDAIRRIAVDGAPSTRARRDLDLHWRPEAIWKELAFLDDPTLRVPDALPAAGDAIVRRLHLGILHEDMPVVVSSVKTDQAEGASLVGAGAQLVNAWRSDAPPAEIAALWQRFPLGKEQVGHQVGSDLFTRTASRTAVVAQAAVSSESSGFGPIYMLLGSLRLPVRLFDLMVSHLLSESKTASAVTVALASVGLLLIGLSVTIDTFPGTLGAFGWSILGAGTVLAVLRAPRGALATIGLLLVAALAVSPWWGAPALVLTIATLMLAALWVLPAIAGGWLLLAGAALWSLGPAGRAEALSAVCSASTVGRWIASVCPSPIPARSADAWARLTQTSLGVAAVVLAWAGWWLASMLRRFDRWLRPSA